MSKSQRRIAKQIAQEKRRIERSKKRAIEQMKQGKGFTKPQRYNHDLLDGHAVSGGAPSLGKHR
jgi:hypothetical protein